MYECRLVPFLLSSTVPSISIAVESGVNISRRSDVIMQLAAQRLRIDSILQMYGTRLRWIQPSYTVSSCPVVLKKAVDWTHVRERPAWDAERRMATRSWAQAWMRAFQKHSYGTSGKVWGVQVSPPKPAPTWGATADA